MTERAEMQSRPVAKVANPWPINWLLLAPLFSLRVWMSIVPQKLYDFIFYWNSGRLFFAGGQPYSQSAMRAAMVAMGGNPRLAVMTFCPPWGMPVTGLMAILPFYLARTTWFGVSLALDLFSAAGLSLYFGGTKRKLWIAIIILATFIPCGAAEMLGQITPLMLASLTALLFLLRWKHNFAAGLMLYGLGFKPQLVFLFLVAIFLWIVKTRAWTVAAGAALALGGGDRWILSLQSERTGLFSQYSRHGSSGFLRFGRSATRPVWHPAYMASVPSHGLRPCMAGGPLDQASSGLGLGSADSNTSVDVCQHFTVLLESRFHIDTSSRHVACRLGSFR